MKLPNRNPGGQLGHATKMVAVIVRRDQLVDLFDASILDRSHDAVGVARCRRAAVACINQQRLAAWRHKQRRVPTLDVDEIDAERFAPDCAIECAEPTPPYPAGARPTRLLDDDQVSWWFSTSPEFIHSQKRPPEDRDLSTDAGLGIGDWGFGIRD